MIMSTRTEAAAMSWRTFMAARDAAERMERVGVRLGPAWRVTEGRDGSFRIDLCPGAASGSRWLLPVQAVWLPANERWASLSVLDQREWHPIGPDRKRLWESLDELRDAVEREAMACG